MIFCSDLDIGSRFGSKLILEYHMQYTDLIFFFFPPLEDNGQMNRKVACMGYSVM